ncbi:uncharacterized protein JCM10292_005162 [Rhodotorula paludigena]|uniref:uncharacterized protein n=1 Tax=Rhodotorula paludigena TaxID=86838 RepID=UPI003177350A
MLPALPPSPPRSLPPADEAGDVVSAPPPGLTPSDVRAADAPARSRSASHSTTLADADDDGEPSRTDDIEATPKGHDGSAEPLDVEHVVVENDPRLWSQARKNTVLAVIAFTAIGGTITASIFFPALESLQRDLNANDDLVAATVSIFIAGQGVFPMFWSAISEVSGRKYCYIVALVIYIVATIVLSRAMSMSVFIAMRAVQALGSAAVLGLGAGTLADMYDTHERGTKLGIFYAAPLIGPAAGPLIGGGLTLAADWRGSFYFLTAYGAVCWLLALWLPDTFRKERSLAWRKAHDRARQHAREKLAQARAALPPGAPGPASGGKAAKGEKAATFSPEVVAPARDQPAGAGPSGFSPLNKVRTALSAKSGDVKVKIHFRDINPLAATTSVLKQPTNTLVLLYSGFLFASQYCVTFTATRTFAAAPYNYSPIEVGLVLLSFGLGNVVGSVGGGRYSDYVLTKMKEGNGGKGEPEMRIKSTYPAFATLPLLFIAYGWLAYYHVHVAAPVVVLFLLGASIMVIYASTLAYIVDANPGRATSAVACNSLFRGSLACAASQSAEPILNHIGNGCFYSGWGILLLLGEAALVVVALRGKRWRERDRTREEARSERRRERNERRLEAARGGGRK